MKISGTSHLTPAPTVVFRALSDPAVLVRTIPGCRRLEALGEDTYDMTLAVGVGSIKGVYDGHVRLTDQQEPVSFRMHADGAGAAGTISADVLVTLRDAEGGGTALAYDADASVGGTIGGVGQRMLVGVSKRMAAEFFRNVEAVLAGAPADLPDGAGASKPSGRASPGLPPYPSTAAPVPSVRSSVASPGAVYTPPPKGRGREGSTFARGVAAGAAAALAGALVGAWVSRLAQGREARRG